MKFIKWLFGLCDHKFVIYKEYDKMETYENKYNEIKKLTTHIIISVYEKCGKIKEYSF